MEGKTARQGSLGEIFTRDFLILATINLTMFFGFQMTTVGIPVYMAQLGADAQIVGLATTLMTVTATAMRVLSGPLLDRFGRTGMLIGGIAIMACAIFSYAVFPIVGVIIGLRLLQGIGWGAGSTASSTIAADIIPKHRFAEGMGYFAMTNAVSSALAPAVSIELAQGAGGAYMVYVSAGITCIALLLSIIEVALGRRKRGAAASMQPKGQARSEASPLDTSSRETMASVSRSSSEEMLDERPDGLPSEQLGGSHRAAGSARPLAQTSGMGAGGPARPPAPASGIEAVFERRALIPGLLIMLVNIGFGCITTFIALHALSRGVSSISPYFVVYAIVTLLSRPLIGKLIDRYGYRIPAILSTLCTAGTLVLIGASTSSLMFAGAGILGGLGLGTAMGTYQAMAVANVEPWRRGVATSTYMTAFDLGIAIGSLVGGFVAATFGYDVMYYFVALFPLLACVVSLAVVKKDEGARL